MVANSQSLAGRYASALYELADKDRVLDAVAEDLVKFRQLMVESEDLNRLIRSPVISRSDQNNGLMAILENAKAKPLTKKFIGAVVMNRRIFVVADIIDVFMSELAERRGEIKAHAGGDEHHHRQSQLHQLRPNCPLTFQGALRAGDGMFAAQGAASLRSINGIDSVRLVGKCLQREIIVPITPVSKASAPHKT